MIVEVVLISEKRCHWLRLLRSLLLLPCSYMAWRFGAAILSQYLLIDWAIGPGMFSAATFPALPLIFGVYEVRTGPGVVSWPGVGSPISSFRGGAS